MTAAPLTNGHSATTNGTANGHHAADKDVSNGKAKQHPHFSFATRAIHVGSEPALSASAAVIPGIELSTTYSQTSAGNPAKGFEYSRSSNPTRLALERVLASLEGADKLLEANLAKEGQSIDSWQGGPPALAVSSGSAATATIVSGLAGQGGHVVSIGDVYGGTSRYMLQVASVLQGVETSFVDMSYTQTDVLDAEESSQQREVREQAEDDEIAQRIKDVLRSDTKLIWIETPTNPMLNIAPIALVAKIAKAHNITLIVDNTFASPYYQNPLFLGADVVVHSVTKYLGGHSDVVGGVIITPHPALIQKFRFLQNAHGAVPSPFDAWLVIRSLKTLSIRARQHGLNALAVARYLEEVARPAGLVRDVRYPGLHRQNETVGQNRERHLAWAQLSDEARRWATKQGFSVDSPGGFPSGGMVSFHIRSTEEASQVDSAAAEKFLQALKVFTLAESLGGVESLAELPLKMTHSGVAQERRKQLGIDGELVRLSVGVEDSDDILQDIEQALYAALH